MDSLAYVDFKHNLKRLQTEAELKEMITTKIREIPTYQALKYDVELTLFICNLIENATKDKNVKKFNKKDFVINVMSELFTLSENDKKILGDQIEFLKANGKIKRVGYIKILRTYFYGWAKRKLL
jgi:Rps23 Pro-64 3,4-dihydroxylase Tpa1-like proline 4-hydroxylase